MLIGWLVILALLAVFLASQIFWVERLAELGRKHIARARLRLWLGIGGLTAFTLLFAWNLLWAERTPSPVHLTLRAALLEAPFRWWVFSSFLGFFAAAPFLATDWLVRYGRSRLGRPPASSVSSPGASPGKRCAQHHGSIGRRTFLAKAALVAGAAPFAVDAYGMVFGRTDLEITHMPIRLARLPKAFDGFRIAQLSDLHIGPFMGAAHIRRIADLTNTLQADLILLTGDFVTWDPSTQQAVVDALSGVRAPFGVFGCLGNHELWTHTENSITRLFAQRKIRILCQEQAEISTQGESINLIGVDYQTHRTFGRRGEGLVHEYLEGVGKLMRPDTANILMSHNPNTFDRAASLGIDLSVAGHTHGGQVTLDYVSPDLSPARFITPFVRGWFKKPGGQLYVNRGIGTIGVPIRFDSPPEITIFKLERA